MNITLEQPLIDYLSKKGYSYISIEAINPKGCCADVTELCTAFYKEKQGAKLAEKAWRCIETEHAKVLLMNRGLEIDDEVILGLKSFLGLKDLSIQGIQPWKL